MDARDEAGAKRDQKIAGVIPSIDLAGEYALLREEIDAAVRGVLASGRYIGGPEVEALEREFAAYCGASQGVALSSGTDALRLALMAAGAGAPAKRGQAGPPEVVTSPLSFIATCEAISQAGARPVFADVDPGSLTLDPATVEAALGPRTRAIVPVHLYGQTADMGPILEIARRRGLAVVEDACQAHGALYRGSAGARGGAAGSLGDVGCFSFYPTKNLGACGEGGMATTSSAEIAARMRRLRDHGQTEKYIHAEEGYNGRLDALQAAILRVKLKRLPGWNARRRALAALYSERLKGMGLARGDGDAGAEPTQKHPAPAPLRLPVERAWGTHVYHLYTVRVAAGGKGHGPSRRDRVRAALLEKGIETGIHYPIPLHRQACYASMGLREGSFPVAEGAAREVLSLPLFPEMTDAQVERVCEALRVVLGRG